jgi:hypothetical protein
MCVQKVCDEKISANILGNHEGIRCYESAKELWKDYGLPVAMSVIDHPRP